MRIQRFGVALIGLALVGAVLLHERPAGAESVPPVLRAQRIELVGSDGRVRAQLKVEPGGEVVFRLRDRTGAVRVKVGASEAGSGLLLVNERTEPGVQILAGRTGTFVSVQRGERRRVVRP